MVEVERQRRGSLYPNWEAEKTCPAEGVVVVSVASARAAARVVRGLVVARVAPRALATREAASRVAKTEAVLEDEVAARGWVGMVEATGMVVETRVARAGKWEADMRAAAATVEAVGVVSVGEGAMTEAMVKSVAAVSMGMEVGRPEAIEGMPRVEEERMEGRGHRRERKYVRAGAIQENGGEEGCDRKEDSGEMREE